MARKRTKKDLTNRRGNLPKEIVFDILSRIPAKSICRFKSVCKNWRSIIQDPIFIQFYSTSSPNRGKALLHVFCSIMNHDFMNYYSVDKDGVAQVSTPNCASHGILVLASCNGLLCTLGISGDIRVCNPATEETVTLPQPKFMQQKLKSLRIVKNTSEVYWARRKVVGSFTIGFGYDSTAENYKVVCWDRNQRSVIEIYTLGKRTWRTLKIGSVGSLGDHLPFYINGASHWYSSYAILTFNFSLGKFGWIQVPKGDRNCSREMCAIGGRLCLVQKYKPRGEAVKLWILVDYDKQEWLYQEIILPISIEKDKHEGVAILGMGDGEILLGVYLRAVYLCRYNDQFQITESIPFPSLKDRGWYNMFKESLESVKVLGCI